LAAPFQQPAPQPISADLPYFPETLNALLPLYGTHQLDNLGTSLTIINELLSSSAIQAVSSALRLRERITLKGIEKGIQDVRWPGRLSFHTWQPASPSVGEEPLIILVDGAHNAASAATLGDYITHLLGLTLQSPSHGTIEIIYIIALSHSPPKTPLETLSPILPPKFPSHLMINCKIETKIILLPFTPPDGMPWVKPVAPENLEAVVRRLVPGAELRLETDKGSPSGGKNLALESALKWVSQRRLDNPTGVRRGKAQLLVLAGSLYLVADFYRIMQTT
jgi:folylpolyglutamate synthase